MEEPGGLPSVGSHRVRHNWSGLIAAAAKDGEMHDFLFTNIQNQTLTSNNKVKYSYSQSILTHFYKISLMEVLWFFFFFGWMHFDNITSHGKFPFLSVYCKYTAIWLSLFSQKLFVAHPFFFGKHLVRLDLECRHWPSFFTEYIVWVCFLFIIWCD